MDKLYIIDASGYLYRSYYAIRQMTNAKGESTNALFGFIRSILKLIKDFNPSYLVAVFDGPQNTRKRSEMYVDYKAHRKGMPGDLLYQIHRAQQYCQLMGIPELMIPDVEADDTMGSVARWTANLGATALICTSDKDMCQLVNDKILVLNTHKENQFLTPKEVEQQFGIPPHQMVDFLAMTGDASDNIPGLPGFGPKTAAKLLQSFGTLDYLLDHPMEIPGKKQQEVLLQEREKALLSRRLVMIDTDVPIPTDPTFYKKTEPSFASLKEFLASMNFSSLIREMESQAIVEGRPSRAEEEVSYQLVDDEHALSELVDYLLTQKEICVDTETTELQPIKAKLVGVGLGIHPAKAWYIPVNGQLGLTKVVTALKPVFENPHIGFFGHNLKYDYHVLENVGIHIAKISFDTMLASYLLNSHSRQHSLDHLALELFDKIKIPIQDLIGKGKKQLSMEDVSLERVCQYCCEDVDYTVRLKQVLAPQLEERKLTLLFRDIELPLLRVLAQMERHGIYVDLPYLQNLSKAISHQIWQLEETIYQMAGETFNLNSPKQLSAILFNKLGIKPPKKIATGHSTNASVLETLQEDHPIVRKLMEYRTLEKLRSTYVETLPAEVNPNTQRIHCTFNQSLTATGRLSCQNPNLQNIPIRTEIGRMIREAFKPQKGDWSYLAADYSQIELRLLAHLSQDPVLISAFEANEDIHRFTAALIFNLPLEAVTPEQRQQAKAVNFGIIYGQQSFGLAQKLGIDTKTASHFIEKYFQRYQKVKEFVEDCKIQARQTGKAVTQTGRERLIPEIHSKNTMIRLEAERFAMNTPIQGTQADLIKMAMIKIDEKMAQNGLKSFMILQIHDELLFEVPNHELEKMKKLVRETMEGMIPLRVPLVVDISIGKNWKEC
jgi:DNA polymerase-1